LLHNLRSMNIIPPDFYTVYAFNLGIVLEAMLLSYAMTDRAAITKKNHEEQQLITIGQLRENEKQKDKLNKELENKVKQRTTELIHKSEELETANIKLRQLTQELNFINSQLDKDNWQLKKQVKNETRSRILSERVSFDEFLQIYPHEHACFQYLSELKWDKGFQCRKCGNNTFSKGEKAFSKKCNRCKYAESVTAGTLFHGVKFPITKAFYIVYDSYNENNRFTIDQLSEIIDLRRVTVWSFRKKVQESKEVKQKQKKNLSGWESLILE
jgi:two-component system, sensor histidine kinase LadS